MSHFTVMVIGDNPEKQLEPFNENLEVPRYVKYTKKQLIDKGKKEIEEYKNSTYAKYLSDKEDYAKGCENSRHLDYLKNEFPRKLNWTDEEIYNDQVSWVEAEDIGGGGEIYSECNPHSKWDWFSLGGRWAGLIKVKDGVVCEEPNFSWGWGDADKKDVLDGLHTDSAIKKDIENIDEIVTFALLKDGKWYERGEMGWWACVSDEKEDDVWDNEFKKLTKDLPEDILISIYDCHI